MNHKWMAVAGFAVCLAVTSVLSAQGQLAQDQPNRGGQPLSTKESDPDEMQSVHLQGVVRDLNKDERTITLEVDPAETKTLKVGPDVRRFDALQPGDFVAVDYYESMAIAIESEDQTMNSSKMGVGPGEVSEPRRNPPDMVLVTQVVAAKVEDINKDKRTVKLRDDRKNIVEMKVGSDVKNFDRIKKGEEVVARYTEALAVDIRPQKSKSVTP